MLEIKLEMTYVNQNACSNFAFLKYDLWSIKTKNVTFSAYIVHL